MSVTGEPFILDSLFSPVGEPVVICMASAVATTAAYLIPFPFTLIQLRKVFRSSFVSRGLGRGQPVTESLCTPYATPKLNRSENQMQYVYTGLEPVAPLREFHPTK